jgi:hypothetical protein
VNSDREWCLKRVGESRSSSWSASSERNPLASMRYFAEMTSPFWPVTVTPSSPRSTSAARQFWRVSQPYRTATWNMNESLSWRNRWLAWVRIFGMASWVASRGSGSSCGRCNMNPKWALVPKTGPMSRVLASTLTRLLISGTS